MADPTATSDERRPTGRIAIAAAVTVIAAFVAGKAARDAIFLSNFNVRMLPLFVGLSAVVSLPLVLWIGKLMTRHGPGRLMPLLNVASAALLVVEWYGLATWPQAAAAACFIHLAALGAVLVSGFWSIINERFDARSAKHHVGRIGVGATIGGVLGGLAAERTAVYLEPGAILLVLAGLQLVCAVALRGLGHAARPAEPPAEAVDAGKESALKLVAKSPLLRGLAVIIVLGAIGAAALDYVFKANVTATMGHEGPLRFFAVFHTVTSVLTAVLQLLFARSMITRVGVARGVGVLPATVTTVGLAALLVPGLASAVVARGAELVMRSSLYRAAYELVYTPLLDRDKRSTKVVLDVGAERVGDLIGAQVVAVLVYLVAVPAPWLLGCAIAAGFVGLCCAMLLPRSYAAALENSLMTRAKDAETTDPEWASISSPTLTEAGDLTSLSLMTLRRAPQLARAIAKGAVRPAIATPTTVPTVRSPVTVPVPVPAATPVRTPIATAPPAAAMEVGPGPVRTSPPELDRDPIGVRLAELRSGDANTVLRALATPLVPELAIHTANLIAWDVVAPVAAERLRELAPRCTGALVDVLLDPATEFAVRRRLPPILVAGDPAHAAWGLTRGLADASFEVRYRCSAALARLRAAGHEPPLASEQVFGFVLRELTVGADVWRSHGLLDPARDQANGDGDEDDIVYGIVSQKCATGLCHVFNLLGLALPADPMRVAFQGLHTDDRTLRATALEYLETVLPGEVRTALWPLIEPTTMTEAGAEPAAADSLPAGAAAAAEADADAEEPAAVAVATDIAAPPAAVEPRRLRTREELAVALAESRPSIAANLRHLATSYGVKPR